MGGQRSGAVRVKLVQVVASQCWLFLCSVFGLWFRWALWWIVRRMVWPGETPMLSQDNGDAYGRRFLLEGIVSVLPSFSS
jgi:hypothetical protein